VWDLLCRHYSIRSEREAHILAGTSMGGGSAFNLGIRYRQNFGIVIGVMPPLNLRWMDGCGGYFGDFEPRSYGWRTDLNRPGEVIARFGVLKLRIGDFVAPLYGMGPDAIKAVSDNNPIELVDRTNLRDGELAMYVAYGGKDEFNLDAQCESFLFLCKCRGITVHVGYDPEGRHNAATAIRLMPGAVRWLNEQLTTYCSAQCRQLCDAACK
jgi:S-formylglutathione hydrolase FrmB